MLTNMPDKEITNYKLSPFVAVLLGLVSLGWIDPLADKVREGNKFYHDSKYDDALDKYVNAQVDSPDTIQLDFNIANTQYKRGKYQEAAQLFEKAIRSGDAEMKAKSSFNMGNTMYRQGKMKEALEWYKRTVDIVEEIEHEAGDELDTLKNDAKYNYEYVERKMQENEQKQQDQDEKDQQQQEEEDKNDEQQSGDNKDEDGENRESEKDEQEPDTENTQEENKSEKEDNQEQSDKEKQKDRHSEQRPPQHQGQKPMTKEEAERFLEALNHSEKETRLMKRDTQRLQHKSVEKDW